MTDQEGRELATAQVDPWFRHDWTTGVPKQMADARDAAAATLASGKYDSQNSLAAAKSAYRKAMAEGQSRLGRMGGGVSMMDPGLGAMESDIRNSDYNALMREKLQTMSTVDQATDFDLKQRALAEALRQRRATEIMQEDQKNAGQIGQWIGLAGNVAGTVLSAYGEPGAGAAVSGAAGALGTIGSGQPSGGGQVWWNGPASGQQQIQQGGRQPDNAYSNFASNAYASDSRLRGGKYGSGQGFVGGDPYSSDERLRASRSYGDWNYDPSRRSA